MYHAWRTPSQLAYRSNAPLVAPAKQMHTLTVTITTRAVFARTIGYVGSYGVARTSTLLVVSPLPAPTSRRARLLSAFSVAVARSEKPSGPSALSTSSGHGSA